MGKLTIKLWNYVLKGKKFEQSCISDRLAVSADISDPLSVIGISAKFHIGASLIMCSDFIGHGYIHNYMGCCYVVIFKVTGWSIDIAEQTVHTNSTFQLESLHQLLTGTNWHTRTNSTGHLCQWAADKGKTVGAHAHRLSSHNCYCMVKPLTSHLE